MISAQYEYACGRRENIVIIMRNNYKTCGRRENIVIIMRNNYKSVMIIHYLTFS